jgi:hypothetical protein
LPDLASGEPVGMTGRLPFDEDVALLLDQRWWQVRDFDNQDIALSIHDDFFAHKKAPLHNLFNGVSYSVATTERF